MYSPRRARLSPMTRWMPKSRSGGSSNRKSRRRSSCSSSVAFIFGLYPIRRPVLAFSPSASGVSGAGRSSGLDSGAAGGGGAEPKTGGKPIFRPSETRPRPPYPFPPRRPIAPRVGAHTKPNGELLALIALADRSPHLRPPESPAVIDFPNSRGFQFPAGNARSPERRPRRRRPKNSRARRGSAAPGANPRMSGSPSPAFIGLYPHMFMWKKDGSPKTFLGKSANPAILNAIMRTRLRES